jgi:hypothetical protein
LLVSLAPGSYTVQVSGVGNTSGVAIIEAYEVGTTGGRLVNLSTRAFSGPGEQSAIVGFGLGGTAGQPVLIRATGPALAAFGVTGALTDPQLKVANAAGVILAQNDNWESSVFAAEIAAATTSVAAFPLAPASRDAAALTLLAPGTYTALATGSGTSAGQTLVEVYVVP